MQKINEFKISFINVCTVTDILTTDFEEIITQTFPNSYWIKKCTNDTGKNCKYPCENIDFEQCNLANSYMFSIANNFLFSDSLPYHCQRIELDHLTINIDIAGITRENTSSIILSYYPDINAFLISLNFKLSDFTLEELIFFRQCFHNSHPFEILESSLIVQNSFKTISQILGTYATEVSKAFSHLKMFGESTSLTTINYTILEINKIEGINTIDFASSEFAQEIYGLLTCDEGLKFVPKETIDKRIKDTWSTRKFIRVIPFYQSSVVLNLIYSDIGHEYFDYQKYYGMKYYGGVNQYFIFNPNIAGLNHGVLFSIESALLMRLLINKSLKNDLTNGKLSLNIKAQTILQHRKGMIDAIGKLDYFGFGEIDDLERLILNSMNILTDIDKLKYYLELTESDIMIKYQHKTNTLITFLTIISLFLALIGILVSFLGSFDNIIIVINNIIENFF